MESETTLASLSALQERIAAFATARDWDQFHSPKNLSMALIAEAAELVEHFQWLTEVQSANLSREKRFAVTEELADILIYLVRIADRLGVDLLAAASNKMNKNELRYPVEKVRGDARRADEYD
jgi:dCTP diphosphatase